MFIKKSLLLVGLSAAFAASAIAQDKKPAQILFTNVNVFDGESDTLTEGMSVLVEGNLIKKIAEGKIDAGSNAKVIDGGGRTLMPGLIDAHVHLTITEPIAVLRDQQDWMYWGAVSGKEAEKMLLRGFTTVRDAGGPAIGLARAIDQG